MSAVNKTSETIQKFQSGILSTYFQEYKIRVGQKLKKISKLSAYLGFIVIVHYEYSVIN